MPPEFHNRGLVGTAFAAANEVLGYYQTFQNINATGHALHARYKDLISGRTGVSYIKGLPNPSEKQEVQTNTANNNVGSGYRTIGGLRSAQRYYTGRAYSKALPGRGRHTYIKSMAYYKRSRSRRTRRRYRPARRYGGFRASGFARTSGGELKYHDRLFTITTIADTGTTINLALIQVGAYCLRRPCRGLI